MEAALEGLIIINIKISTDLFERQSIKQLPGKDCFRDFTRTTQIINNISSQYKKCIVTIAYMGEELLIHRKKGRIGKILLKARQNL